MPYPGRPQIMAEFYGIFDDNDPSKRLTASGPSSSVTCYSLGLMNELAPSPGDECYPCSRNTLLPMSPVAHAQDLDALPLAALLARSSVGWRTVPLGVCRVGESGARRVIPMLTPLGGSATLHRKGLWILSAFPHLLDPAASHPCPHESTPAPPSLPSRS